MSEVETTGSDLSEDTFDQLERMLEAFDEWDALPWHKRIFRSRAHFILEATQNA